VPIGGRDCRWGKRKEHVCYSVKRGTSQKPLHSEEGTVHMTGKEEVQHGPDYNNC